MKVSCARCGRTLKMSKKGVLCPCGVFIGPPEVVLFPVLTPQEIVAKSNGTRR
jgi:NADH pyrophosphatase NudC (nudix superfamily)